MYPKVTQILPDNAQVTANRYTVLDLYKKCHQCN